MKKGPLSDIAMIKSAVLIVELLFLVYIVDLF